MNKILKSRRFQIISAIFLLLIVILFSADRFSKANIVRDIITAPVAIAQKGIKAAGIWIDGIVSGIKGYARITSENESLRNENLELYEKNAELAGMEAENQRLREALKLKDRFSGYEIIGANIIGVNPGNFFYNFRIDIGSLDGVETDDPVIAADNVLIGRIYSVGLTTSVVVPLTDERTGISAWTTKTDGGHAVVKGDIEYKALGLCLMDTISQDVNLEIGDVVETSGMGGIYPRGILIGTVEEIYKETSLIERHAVIKPYVDFNSIQEVYILKEKEPGN
ncbi:MAG: rod shape-determining protein MreC [Clostridia bacterium]|nr:rod shape-determining protein MreC [Clostridia bacterium]